MLYGAGGRIDGDWDWDNVEKGVKNVGLWVAGCGMGCCPAIMPTGEKKATFLVVDFLIFSLFLLCGVWYCVVEMANGIKLNWEWEKRLVWLVIGWGREGEGVGVECGMWNAV